MEQHPELVNHTETSFPVDMYQISGHEGINTKDIERYIKDKKQNETIQEIAEALKGTSIFIQKRSVSKTPPTLLPDNHHVENITPSTVLPDKHHVKVELQKIGAENLDVPEKELLAIIKKVLAHHDVEVQKEAVRMIPFAPKGKKALLIKQVMDNPNVEVQKAGAERLFFAPKEEIALLIKQAIDNPNVEVQKAGVEKIFCAPEEERALLIKQAIDNPNVEVQKAGMKMFGYTTKKEQEELLKLFAEKKLLKYLISPPLYDKKPEMNGQSFSREKFDKDGSETVLIGGPLKDRLIVRFIDPRAFLVWQHVYENYQVWKNAGFDYVPIEPIQSYRLNKDKLVEVYSGVLDLSLDSWLNISDMFTPDLIKQRDKIKSVLDSLNIFHVHPHGDNFCLRFFRDENGEPDMTKTPRLYLIDFDVAHFRKIKNPPA